MRKFMVLAVAAIAGMAGFCSTARASLVSPVLTVTVNGLNVTASWTSADTPDGYIFYYAPYPEADPIYQLDLGTQTSLSADLWDGAALYLAVQAYDSSGNTAFSNVENIMIGQGGPGSGDPGDPPGGSSGQTGSSEKTGAYELADGTDTVSGGTYTATDADQSGVYVYDAGTLDISGTAINKTAGDTSSEEESNFYGLNAIVLAEDESTVNLTNCTLYSSAEGSNGAFAYGEGSTVNLEGCTIETTGNSSRGVDATYGGVINVSDTTISTQGDHCAAIASDRYENNDPPTVNADNCTGTTKGDGSPGIYCTGTFYVTNSNLSAGGSEAAAIEGLNSITLKDSTISGAKKWGVIIYQSMSGDSSIGTGTFDMSGGELANNTSGPVFMVCNTTAEIYLDHVDISTSGSVLIRATDAAAGDDNVNTDWGTAGGDVVFKATDQTLEGTVSINENSSLDMTLSGTSTLTGHVEDNDGQVGITLEDDSAWTATGDSYVNALNGENLPAAVDAATGITIYYENSDTLSGNYSLASGGLIKQL